MDFQQAIAGTKEEYRNPDRQNEEKEVVQKYGYMFHLDNLKDLSKEDFKSFLLIKNNKHWEGIHRQRNLITDDMAKLRHALNTLLDESKPLKERLDFLFPKNKANYIKGLGRAIVTPVLMVVYPDKYGVYNRRSAEGLKKVGLEPKFSWGANFSEKYIKVNEVLNRLSIEHEMSFFQLDSVWWRITEGYKPPQSQEEQEEEQETEELSTGFGLELHLRRFLVDNWENTPFGQRYQILNEDGEMIGEEFQAKGVGIIDILARHNSTKEWLVIELKKGRSSDVVIGQILRYMGWIQKNKVEKGESVKGVIIVKEVDDKMTYALAPLKDKINVSCLKYNVQFSLSEV